MYSVTLYVHVHTLSIHIVFFAIFLQGVQFVSQAFKAVEVGLVGALCYFTNRAF